MYKSLAAALLVAATEAAAAATTTTTKCASTYCHDFFMTVPTGNTTGKEVKGAIYGFASSTTCKFNIENTAKETKVKTTQTAVLAAKLVTDDDSVEVGCSWKEGSAQWWFMIAQVFKGGTDKYYSKAYQHSITTAPDATKFTSDTKLLTAGPLKATAELAKASAAATAISPSLSGVTQTTKAKYVKLAWSMSTDGKTFTAVDDVTYTGTDEKTAKGVFDTCKEGMASTLQGVSSENKLSGKEYKKSKSQIIKMNQGSLSNIVAAAAAICALSMAF